MNIAFITGITGQDGSYLTEFLLDKNYIVWGLIRRSSTINTSRIDHIFTNKNLILRYGDLSDTTNIIKVLNEIKERYSNIKQLEIYNMAAMSHVKVSFDMPEYTANIDAIGTLRILEAIRICGLKTKVKFYQASTSEMYGKVQEIPQTETTPFYPRSPYGVAKLYSYWITKNYRESYDMFICNGILFNHESPRRGHTFVTRKITRGIGMILSGERDCIELGNLDAKRDWGHTLDFIKGMWMMLQHNEPDDYVLATGEYHSVREFVELAFSYMNIKIIWKGIGVNEVGIDRETGKTLVKVSKHYYRPCEVEELLGDASKAKKILGWKPKITFKELVKEMIEYDCKNYIQ